MFRIGLIQTKLGLLGIFLSIFTFSMKSNAVVYSVDADWEKEKVLLYSALFGEDGYRDPPLPMDEKASKSVEVVIRDAPQDKAKEIARLSMAINYDSDPKQNAIVVRRDRTAAYIPLIETHGPWGKLMLNRDFSDSPQGAWIKEDRVKVKIVSMRTVFEDEYLQKKDNYYGVDLSVTDFKTFKTPDEKTPSVVFGPKSFQDENGFVDDIPLVQVLEVKKFKEHTFVKIGFLDKGKFYPNYLAFEGFPYEQSPALKKLDGTWLKLTNVNHNRLLLLDFVDAVEERRDETIKKQALLRALRSSESAIKVNMPGAKENLEVVKKELAELDKAIEERRKARLEKSNQDKLD